MKIILSFIQICKSFLIFDQREVYQKRKVNDFLRNNYAVIIFLNEIVTSLGVLFYGNLCYLGKLNYRLQN